MLVFGFHSPKRDISLQNRLLNRHNAEGSNLGFLRLDRIPEMDVLYRSHPDSVFHITCSLLDLPTSVWSP